MSRPVSADGTVGGVGSGVGGAGVGEGLGDGTTAATLGAGVPVGGTVATALLDSSGATCQTTSRASTTTTMPTTANAPRRDEATPAGDELTSHSPLPVGA